MLTKGAIGNLVNRYKAVLKKCNLINTFGSLAVASMLVLGSAGVAEAAKIDSSTVFPFDGNKEVVTVEGDLDKSIASGFIISNATIKLSNGQKLTLASNDDSDNGIFKNVAFTGKEGILTLKDVNSSGLYIIGNNGAEIDVDEFYIYHKNTSSLAHAIYQSRKINDSKPITISANKIYIESYADAIHLESTTNKDVTLHSTGDIDIISKGDAYGIQNASPVDKLIITSNKNVYISSSKRTAISQQDASETSISAQKIEIHGFLESHDSKTNAVNVTGGTLKLAANEIEIYDDNANETSTALGVTTNGTLDIASASTSINGDVSNSGTIKFEGGKTEINGEVSGAQGTIEANNAKLYLHGSNDLGTVTGSGSSIVLDVDTKKVTLNNQSTNLGYKATAALNDNKSATDIANLLTGDTGNMEFQGADEGFVAPELDTDGNAKGPNRIMDAALKQASINTVALDRILTNDVRKRLGDIRSDANTTGVWMRWDGGKLKGDNGLTNNFNTIQIGGDTKVAKNCRLGVAGSFTHGDGDFARGSSELEGFSFAAYATWMGDNGMFADIVARIGSFSTEMNVEGYTGDMDNRVASLSGEYGWRFNVCQQFFIEPQVELAYTYVSSDDLQLDTAKYQFDSVDSLTGRAGLVAGWNLPNEMGNVYARASVVQQFMGDAKITGNNGRTLTQEIDGEDTWLEYGIGANVKLTDNAYIWADVERTEGAEIDEEWRGTVGFRYSF